jgi:hypothetical protein
MAVAFAAVSSEVHSRDQHSSYLVTKIAIRRRESPVELGVKFPSGSGDPRKWRTERPSQHLLPLKAFGRRRTRHTMLEVLE